MIGCGAIGTVLAEAIERKIVICEELVVYDSDASKAQKLKTALNFPVTIVGSVDELLALKPRLLWKRRHSKPQKITLQKSFLQESS